MAKRPADDDETSSEPAKRVRTQQSRIFDFSDELLLRVFSFLSVTDLVQLQSVSSRFNVIAGDSQLWKSVYAHDFIEPQLQRIAAARQIVCRHGRPSSLSRLIERLRSNQHSSKKHVTDWKREYKLKHNWTTGVCGVTEIPVADNSPEPSVLARLCSGVVYTADKDHGLRAWYYKDEKGQAASLELDVIDRSPSALATDIASTGSEHQRLVVGFDDGSFDVFEYSKYSREFQLLYTHKPYSAGTTTACALDFPHLLILHDQQSLSLYKFDAPQDSATTSNRLQAPRNLTTLCSSSIWSPFSLSLRTRSASIFAAVAYCLPTHSHEWTVGIQELQVSLDGDILQSRVASAENQGFVPLTGTMFTGSNFDTTARRVAGPRPTSLSYTHPYLLVAHSDNTLTLHMVLSNDSWLSIGSGKRLWGHTSAVFDAHVGERGKAVSVSTRGEEVRVWELEGGGPANLSTGAGLAGDWSIAISTEQRRRPSVRHNATLEIGATQGSGALLALLGGETSVTKGWVGFDEEHVVVLRERGDTGLQALAVYDFT